MDPANSVLSRGAVCSSPGAFNGAWALALTPTGDIFRFERSRTTRFNERTLASFSNPDPPFGQPAIGSKVRVVSINEGFDAAS